MLSTYDLGNRLGALLLLSSVSAQQVIGLFDDSGSAISSASPTTLSVPTSASAFASPSESLPLASQSAVGLDDVSSTPTASAVSPTITAFVVPTPVPSGQPYSSAAGDTCAEWGCGMLMSSAVQPSCMPAVQSWAYSSMNCGYGYTRGTGGYCVPASWYSTSLGCYETTIIHRERPSLPYISKLSLTPPADHAFRDYRYRAVVPPIDANAD